MKLLEKLELLDCLVTDIRAYTEAGDFEVADNLTLEFNTLSADVFDHSQRIERIKDELLIANEVLTWHENFPQEYADGLGTDY